jgi:hypothetical protein
MFFPTSASLNPVVCEMSEEIDDGPTKARGSSVYGFDGPCGKLKRAFSLLLNSSSLIRSLPYRRIKAVSALRSNDQPDVI